MRAEEEDHPAKTRQRGKNSEAAGGRPRSLAAFGGMLRRARVALGLTLDDLMAKTGISKPYLSNIETGRAPGPASEDKLRRIARVLGLAEKEVLAGADWLRTPASVRRLVLRSGSLAAEGEGGVAGGAHKDAVPRRADGAIDLDAVVRGGEALPAEDSGTQLGNGQVKSVGAGDGGHFPREDSGNEAGRAARTEIPLRSVPLINRVAAGRASEYTDLDYPRGVADAYVPVPDLPEFPVGSAFGVRVVGDSMMPEYGEGEILIVGPAGEGALAVSDGDDCVVRLGEAENFATTFKRVFFVRDGEGRTTGVRLAALNPAYAERVVAMEMVSGIYRVLWRMKPGRGT